MIDFRPILFVLGLLLAVLGLAMMLPALVDLAAGNPDWMVFTVAAAVSGFAGLGLILTNRGQTERLNIRQAFLLTTLSWLVIAFFGALPFTFSNLGLSFTDAFFEAMSGITTTGSTVMTGLDEAPPGILIWRALLQWLGGVGIIVMAIAVLPMLQVGGMQLFRLESSDTSEKILPRAAQIASAIFSIYVMLTAICATSYWLAGMPGFDAIAHSMTTIATGGFSTSDQSVGLYDSARIDFIATLFMVMGSLPFVLYLYAVRGRPGRLFRDSQVRWFFGIAGTAVATMILWLWLVNEFAVFEAARFAAFNTVSIMTGTGYSTANYGAWGFFPMAVMFFIMFVGGCAGSTSCGIKIFRFQVLYEYALVQIRRLIQPHGVHVPHFNGRPISQDVTSAVMGFFFLFVVCYVVLALALAALGLDFVTAASGAATAISNVGPALGDIIGPTGTFQPLPDGAKWLLSAGMLLGRLELFTVLVILTPTFWRP